MNNQIDTVFETMFENEVYKGLTDYPKHLSSKYFYDAKGDALFQYIMQMPEYYLTDAEYDIFTRQKTEIATLFSKNARKFDLVELGSGDGKKTKVLLHHFIDSDLEFEYLPIDISQNALVQLNHPCRKNFLN